MIRNEHLGYMKLHRLFPDATTLSMQLKIDWKNQKVVGQKTIAQSIVYKCINDQQDNDFEFKFKPFHSNDSSSIRVIRLGGVEDLNRHNFPINVAPLLNANGNNGKQPFINQNGTIAKALKRGDTKVPNFPMMTVCQNCDTHFPTKYQFQRHQCEFNANKVVLKANVAEKDTEDGVRMKFSCSTCGKQFVSKNNLDRHLISHDKDNVNICKYCQKQFVSENRLRIHKENHCKKAGGLNKFYRSDVKVWRCKKCYQVFSSNEYAGKHANACMDLITDPEALKNANEGIKVELVELKNEDDLDCKDDENNPMSDDGSPSASINPFIDMVCTELLLHCEFCNRTYANKYTLLWHQDTHTTSVNYNCVNCKTTFESYINAAKHWLAVCANEANLFYLPKLIYCKCCDRTFKSHEILYMHKIKKKHYCPKKHTSTGNEYVPDKHISESSLINDEEDKDDDAEVDPKPEDQQTTKENIGQIKEDERKHREETVQSKEPLILLMEDVCASNRIERQQELDESDNVSIKSEKLSHTSLTQSEYTPSIQEKNPEKKKKRGRKRKSCAQYNRSKKMTANVESGYKYQCERCIIVFNTISDLEMHRNKDHPANYKCEECDQVVHSAKALMIHSRAHQSLKPYVCEICKRCYSQTSHLWQHMRFHQGIKPFACPHEGCEARYTIRPDLKDHIRKVHTRERPFKCSVCNKCFLTGSVYYQHRLIHTNDRRYACDVCNKRFFRADALNNHRRIHTDERPYPCNVCGRNFRQKGDRNKHVRTQHPDFQM